MPFKSEKQRRFLWAKHPEIAKRWAHKYPESNKNLPTYASEDSEKESSLLALSRALASGSGAFGDVNTEKVTISNSDNIIKNSADGLMYVKLPKKSGPSYAGEEGESGPELSQKPENAENPEDKALDEKNPVAQKLAVVLGPKLREVMEQQMAAEQGRNALPVPQNLGLKRYAVNPAAQVMPPGFGLGQPAAQPAAQPQQPNQGPVGGGSNPAQNPINSYGPLSQSGVINGNAAFGQKNSPDSMKAANADQRILDLVKQYGKEKRKRTLMGLLGLRKDDETYVAPGVDMMGHKMDEKYFQPDWKPGNLMVRTNGPDPMGRFSAHENDPMGAMYSPGAKSASDSGAWTRSEGKNPEGGLNAKGRASLKAQGHDIKAPVTESNPSGERAKRQNSFCSRMCGMKKVNTGAETKSDPDSRINKSLRKWNCKCGSAFAFGQQVKESVDVMGHLGNFAQGLGTSWNNSARTFKGLTGAVAGGIGAAGAGLAGAGMQAINAPVHAYNALGKGVNSLTGQQTMGQAGTPFSNEAVNTAYGTAQHYGNMGKAYGQDMMQGLGLGEHGLNGTVMDTPSRGDAYVRQTQQLPGVTDDARRVSNVGLDTADFAAKAAPAAAIGAAAKGVQTVVQGTRMAPWLHPATKAVQTLNSKSNPTGAVVATGLNAANSWANQAPGGLAKASALLAAGAAGLIDIIEKQALDPYRGMLQAQRGFLKSQQPYMQAANVIGPHVVSGAVGLASGGNPLYKGVSRMTTQGATQFMLNRLNSQIGKLDKQLRPGTPVQPR